MENNVNVYVSGGEDRTKRRALVHESVATIEGNQAVSGAYVASPTFSQYGYSWLRDGSFIGYGMLVSGRPDSTERFLRWTAAAVDRAPVSPDSIERARREGREPGAEECFPARYTLDGNPVGDKWPAFQTDGYGAWLWLLDRWMDAEGIEAVPEWAGSAVTTTIAYLERAWDMPTYDAWEENGDKVHPATLACIYGGLTAMHRRGVDAGDRGQPPGGARGHARAEPVGQPGGEADGGLGEWAARAGEIAVKAKELACSRPTTAGSLPKYLGSEEVDASLLWAAVPFGMLAPDEPLMLRTAEAIERDLKIEGGLKRFAADTFFGGGRWLLLTAWWGWYRARLGDLQAADEAARWIESQATEDGALPEQVTDLVDDPAKTGEWTTRWGPVATPLLWSHAMYLVLVHQLERAAQPESG